MHSRTDQTKMARKINASYLNIEFYLSFDLSRELSMLLVVW